MLRRLNVPAFLISSLLCVHRLAAQDADTTQAAPPDTLLLAPSISDSLAQVRLDSSAAAILRSELVPFQDALEGLAVGDTLPARHPSLDAVGILGEMAGSFVYDFGAAGWPDGWSPFALNPNAIDLSFNDIPFNDAITGRPSYELLPLSILKPLRLQADRYGAPLTVNTRLRLFDSGRPLTQIRYGTTSNGLQSVLVMHNQVRQIPFRQQTGAFGFTLGYGGHGASNEYAGSRLEGARQLLARVRYAHPLGSIELTNLNNRRRLGAHAGVVPTGSVFETIYNRFSAQVTNPNALRQELRNDLGLTLRNRLVPGLASPFTATGYWTASTFRYVDADTLQARISRLGYSMQQELTVASKRLVFRLEGWREKLRPGSPSLPDSPGIVRRSLHASVQARFDVAGFDIDLQPGLHRTVHDAFAGGQARIARSIGGFGVFAEASRSGNALSWVQEYGWGSNLAPLPDAPASRTTLLHGGIRLAAGPFSLGLSAFVQQSEDQVDFLSDNVSDTVRAAAFSTPVAWNGATIDFGFRRQADRGFYLTAAPSAYFLKDAESSAAHRALGESLPELFAVGRTGLRYVLFKGDLDMDLYTQGRLWSTFRSRTLHPQTGLLVLRDDGARDVEGSATVDVVLEAGVRTAKLFVAFENLFSGTTVIPGNMLVATYPLPERRFRFGVYWPIQD